MSIKKKTYSMLKITDFKVGDRVQHYTGRTGTVIDFAFRENYTGRLLLVKWDKPLPSGATLTKAFPTSVVKLEVTPKVSSPKVILNHKDNKKTLSKTDSEKINYDTTTFQEALERVLHLFDIADNFLFKSIKYIYSDADKRTVTVVFDGGDADESTVTVHASPNDNFDVNVGVALAIAYFLAGNGPLFKEIVKYKTLPADYKVESK